MNGSLPPSNGNNGGCMERYANRYAVHPQQQQSHTLHSASPLHLHPGNQPPFPSLTNGGSASVAGSAPGSTGYYHHHQQQTLYRSASHPSGSAPPLPAGHGGGPGSYMAGANGWTGVPLISTASSNRRPRKNFGAGGGSSGGSNAPGNHYHHQHHPPNQYQQQQQQQQQPHFGQTLPKSNSAEFDENANLTRLALHAHGAPLILSANRYHHGSSHRNHKSSSSTPSSSVAAGAKIVTSASRAGEPENSSNFSARPSKQHPVQQLHGSAPSAAYETVSSHHAQHHPHQQLSASSSSASSTSGGLEYGLNGPVTSGSTANPNPTSTAMSTSVSSSSSSSTEMCLPRIIKPRKRRKKDRKPNAPTANGGTAATGGSANIMCPDGGAGGGCGVASLPCLDSQQHHIAASLLHQHQHHHHQHLQQHQQPHHHLPYGPGAMLVESSNSSSMRDILNELSYLTAQSPQQVVFPERLTAELTKFLAHTSALSAQLPIQQQQYSQLHGLLVHLQQQQQQIQHQQQLLQAQQQQQQHLQPPPQLHDQQQQQQQMLLPQHLQHPYLPGGLPQFMHQSHRQPELQQQLSSSYCSVSSPGSESNDSGVASALGSGFFFPPAQPTTAEDVATAPELLKASFATGCPAAAPRPTLPEPASPSSSASSACSCRLCDPFGRIWAFPMLRQQQEQPCTAALADTTFHEPSVESGAPAGRKKDVGVIGSNRSAPGSSSFRGEWRSTSECAPPSRATHTTGAVLDGGVSRKGSFSDSGSDSGCDLLLSGLPGLCSTEEEDEEDDEEEQEEDDDDDEEEPEEEAEGDGEPDGHDSLLSSANQPSASGAGFAHFLVPSFGLPPSSSSPSGGALAAKAADDELLLISELTKKLHETLDLVSDSGCGGPDGAARSGSCSSSSSSSSSSNSSSCGSSSSSSSSGVGSLLGGPSSSSGVDVFVNFDAMSRNRLFGYGHGQRLFAGDESLVIEGSGSAGASEMFQKNGPARGTVQSMLGEVKDANGGAKMVDRTGASEFVQCDRRNPLSLRPISVVGSLLGGGGFSNSDPFGRDQQHHQQQQQQQQQKQSHIASYLFAPLESLQDPALSVANGGDMLNCFDTVWSGSDHSLLLPASDHLA